MIIITVEKVTIMIIIIIEKVTITIIITVEKVFLKHHWQFLSSPGVFKA